jgi:trk system potassium uptake protein TrkH
MHWRAITRLFGILLMLYSLSFLPSISVALIYADGQLGVFATSLIVTVVMGWLLWLPNRKEHGELRVREGFLIVSLFWVLAGAIGALPFILGLHLGITDSIFESVSGFTTTGITVVLGLDQLPASILYHRQQIQWFGGAGFVLLMVAIMPLLGVGGMQLYRAEVPGVAKEEKLTPRIANTARALWIIYVALTVACALAYWLAGMTPFDAIGHAYATIATGGFSTHDASFGHWDSQLLESIAIFFMLAAGVNFSIHFLAWRRKGIGAYFKDPETRAYTLIFIFTALFIAASLYWAGTYTDEWQALRHSAFQVASILTNTGFGTATFGEWPLHVPLVLVAISYIGGCAGSTAGGMKVLRIMLLAKLGMRQLFHLAHPKAVSVVKIGKRPVSDDVLFAVWGFYVLYIITVLLLTAGMMATGLDLESAFGAVTAAINNLGPGLGETASNFTTLTPIAKWLGIVAMLVGRLEVFTILILFTPAYWQH